MLPDGPISLTATVGPAPRVIAARSPERPAAKTLVFANDSIDRAAMGGDLLIAAYASDLTALMSLPNALPTVTTVSVDKGVGCLHLHREAAHGALHGLRVAQPGTRGS